MNRVAGATDDTVRSESADWRTLFRAEMARRPADVESTLERYRSESVRAEEFLRKLDLMTLPDVELRVTETQNPIIRQSFPLALYSNGQLAVTTSATADPDPSYLANHCEVCIPPLAVHEAYPGHHVSFWHLGRVSKESVATAQHSIVQHNNMFLLEGLGALRRVFDARAWLLRLGARDVGGPAGAAAPSPCGPRSTWHSTSVP